MGGFTPIIDPDTGEITGYKTNRGADTVFPFSNGGWPVIKELILSKLSGNTQCYIMPTEYLIACTIRIPVGDTRPFQINIDCLEGSGTAHLYWVSAENTATHESMSQPLNTEAGAHYIMATTDYEGTVGFNVFLVNPQNVKIKITIRN